MKKPRALSGYERMVAEGVGYSRGVLEGGMVAKTVKAMMQVQDEIVAPDGTTIRPTIIEEIAFNTLMDARDNPSTTKLKDLANIMGELKTNLDVNANLQTGKDLFEDIANKE